MLKTRWHTENKQRMEKKNGASIVLTMASYACKRHHRSELHKMFLKSLALALAQNSSPKHFMKFGLPTLHPTHPHNSTLPRHVFSMLHCFDPKFESLVDSRVGVLSRSPQSKSSVRVLSRSPQSESSVGVLSPGPQS